MLALAWYRKAELCHRVWPVGETCGRHRKPQVRISCVRLAPICWDPTRNSIVLASHIREKVFLKDVVCRPWRRRTFSTQAANALPLGDPVKERGDIELCHDGFLLNIVMRCSSLLSPRMSGA